MGYPATDPIVRLLRKSVSGINGCVEWVGYKDKDGYGKIWDGGTMRLQGASCHAVEDLLYQRPSLHKRKHQDHRHGKSCMPSLPSHLCAV